MFFGHAAFAARILYGGEIAVTDFTHPLTAAMWPLIVLQARFGLSGEADSEKPQGSVVVGQAIVVSVEKTSVGFSVLAVAYGYTARLRDVVSDCGAGPLSTAEQNLYWRPDQPGAPCGSTIPPPLTAGPSVASPGSDGRRRSRPSR